MTQGSSFLATLAWMIWIPLGFSERSAGLWPATVGLQARAAAHGAVLQIHFCFAKGWHWLWPIRGDN